MEQSIYQQSSTSSDSNDLDVDNNQFWDFSLKAFFQEVRNGFATVLVGYFSHLMVIFDLSPLVRSSYMQLKANEANESDCSLYKTKTINVFVCVILVT